LMGEEKSINACLIIKCPIMHEILTLSSSCTLIFATTHDGFGYLSNQEWYSSSSLDGKVLKYSKLGLPFNFSMLVLDEEAVGFDLGKMLLKVRGSVLMTVLMGAYLLRCWSISLRRLSVRDEISLSRLSSRVISKRISVESSARVSGGGFVFSMMKN